MIFRVLAHIILMVIQYLLMDDALNRYPTAGPFLMALYIVMFFFLHLIVIMVHQAARSWSGKE